MRVLAVGAFLPASLVLLSYFPSPVPERTEAKKSAFVPQQVSPKQADAGNPRFVLASGKLHLMWRERKGEDSVLSIAGIDKESKRLEPNREVKTKNIVGPGFGSVVLFDAVDAEASPPAGNPPPAFLVTYDIMPHVYHSNWPTHLAARLTRDPKVDMYGAETLGHFLPDGIELTYRGGLIDPQQVSLLRRRSAKGRPLFLVGSNYSQIWSVSSNDGKKWSAPHVIARDEDHANVVETSAGELFLFSAAQTRWSDGRRAEIILRRSKDGKSWSDAKAILEGHDLRKTCAFVDRKLIWLAYADKNEQRDGSTIFLTRSSDEGKTWETPVPLTDGIHDDSEPVLAIQDEHLYLAFARVFPRPGRDVREWNVDQRIWYGHKAIGEIKFPRAE